MFRSRTDRQVATVPKTGLTKHRANTSQKVLNDPITTDVASLPHYDTTVAYSGFTGNELPPICSPSSSRRPSSAEADMSANLTSLRNRLSSWTTAIVPAKAQRSSDSIGWKHTKQGVDMISRSVNEASSSPQEVDLTRRLYIDGAAYILSALPTDLTAEERLRIGVAMPPQGETETRPHSPETIDSDTTEEVEQAARPVITLVWLRPVTARIAVFTILWLKVFISYLSVIIRMLYRYDREYHISDRMIVQATVLLDWSWKSSMSAINRVCSMNDGQVGMFLSEVMKCFAEEVSNGLHDGLAEIFKQRGDAPQADTNRFDGTESDSS